MICSKIVTDVVVTLLETLRDVKCQPIELQDSWQKNEKKKLVPFLGASSNLIHFFPNYFGPCS